MYVLVTKNFLVKVQLSKAAIFSCRTTTRILKKNTQKWKIHFSHQMHRFKGSISKCNYFKSISGKCAVMKCQVTNPWQLLRVLPLSSQPHQLPCRKCRALIHSSALWGCSSCSQSSIKKQEWSCKGPELLSLN